MLTCFCIAGLDPPSRERLHETLQTLHEKASPRIIVGLRHGEDVPPWISHILEIREGSAVTKLRSTMHQPSLPQKEAQKAVFPTLQAKTGEIVAELKGVSVAYGDRRVCAS